MKFRANSIVFATMAVMTAASNLSVAADDPAHPNVILVMADDMGWGQTGYMNHPVLKTPNLDAMAAGGMRMDRFYAGAPVCSPTRASVLTGRSNDRTGVRSHGYAMHLQETSLASLMKEAGYVTGHFGKWHLNGLRGPGVPILVTDPHHPGHFGFDTWLSVTNFFDRDPILSRRGKFVEFSGDSSEIIVDEMLDFAERQQKTDQPFFAVVWYGTPHDPFRADPIDAEPFDGLDDQSREHHGELVAMDRSIGTLRRKLRALNIADNTLIWFCSDNGGLGKIKPDTTGGLRGSKGTIYEGGLRVPAIIEWPDRIKQPVITKYQACTMDILPTILDVIGADDISPAVPLDGISLLPVIDSLQQDGSDKSLHQSRPAPIFFRHEGKLAVIDGDWKLLTTNIRKQKFELYHLADDPIESANMFSKRPDVAMRLMKLLIQWNESVDASAAGRDYPTGAVGEGYPIRKFWTTLPEYQTFFEAWQDRPEYARWIKRARAEQ